MKITLNLTTNQALRLGVLARVIRPVGDWDKPLDEALQKLSQAIEAEVGR